MKALSLRRTLAGALACIFCLSAATTVTAFAAGSASSSSSGTPSANTSGTAPSGTPGGTAPSGTPPTGGSGTAPSGTAPSGTPPTGGSGTAPSGTAPSGGSGTAPSGTPPTGGSGTAPSGKAPSGTPGGADTMTYDYTGTLSGALTADGEEKTSDGETIAAAQADQNAALAENGGTLTITGGTLTKSGDDTNGDNCNFYGINSILLAVGDGSGARISGSSLSAGSEGSNGIFATDNATVYANSDTIATSADNSRGLDATYGGTIVANDLDIATQGDHCAAVATDRGGGNISLTNSTLSTAGSGSPLLYSTGDIEADNVTGTAAGSQIAGMEGLNTILIYNSTLESTSTSATASDPMADGVIIYQSTSGDAESTTGEAASFQAVDSTLKSAIQSGAMFYLTNTTASVVLSNTVLDFDSANVKLLEVQGNDANNWGTAGSNGAAVTFTGLGETLTGDIDVDTISTLQLCLLQNTTYTGAVAISRNAVNTAASDAPVTVNLDGTSRWVVTADSTVTNLNAADGAQIVDADGKTVTIVADGKTAVAGESSVTLTVTGSYSTSVPAASAGELTTDFIDRTGFDSCYATSTAFSDNGAKTAASAASAEQETAPQKSRFRMGALAAILAVGAALGGVSAVVYRRKHEQDSDGKE